MTVTATPLPDSLVRRIVELCLCHVDVADQRRVLAAALDSQDEVDPVGLIDRLHADQEALPAAQRTDAAVAALADHGVRVAIPGTSGYPPALMMAWPELGAPLWLFATGSGQPPAGPAVAVVGTRHPTVAGVRFAARLAGALAQVGALVVSGMARGIDQAAHRGALSAGGRTCAVLGTGVGVDYPRGSADLHAAVAASGGVFTELLPGTPPRPPHFLARNRIISGLCDLTVVVEGRARSGALHTARMAAAQGRDVWAVPGSPEAVASQAPLALIRDGAQVVTRVEDVIEAVDLSPGQLRLATPDRRRRDDLDAAQRTVLDLLGTTPVAIDDLVDHSGLQVATVMAVVAQLARRGLAVDGPDGVSTVT